MSLSDIISNLNPFTPFYVYAYVDEVGQFYYIGKGSKARWKRYHGEDIPVPPENRVVLLECNLTEEDAYMIECREIERYGRAGIDEDGILLNRTKGGNGAFAPATDEARKNMSDAARGKPKSESHKNSIRLARLGVSHLSDESKLKIKRSLGHPETYSLVSPEGVVHTFENMTAFCYDHELHVSAVSSVISGKRQSTHGWTRATANLNDFFS
jgi:hypothetical protein